MSLYERYSLKYPGQMRCLVYSVGDEPPCFEMDIRIVHAGTPYIALSYTWGDSAPTRSITVKGGELQVGQNLFDFLNTYISHYQPPRDLPDRPRRHFWIDQICINQLDIAEQTRQVNMMNRIYKMAHRVLVWLGCDAEMVEAARQIRDNQIQNAHTVATILRHPYFTRVWTVQEIALAQHVDVLCGSVQLKLSDVQVAATSMRGRPGWEVSSAALSLLHEHDESRSAAARRTAPRTPLESPTLQYCISQYSLNDCTYPRDRVYGMLGMTSERWRIALNYEKPVLEVYLDAMVALCEELFDRLDPQCFYGTTLDRHSGQILYIRTILGLARAMGFPNHQTNGLTPFVTHLLAIYLDTPKRMIQYTYRESIPSLHQANEKRSRTPLETFSFPGELSAPSEKCDHDTEVEATAVRRNPLLRDVVPHLGLQLARDATSSLEADVDRWWFEHDGKRFYFDCLSGDGGASNDSE